MALSKGLRLLGRLGAAGDCSVLLEARGRGDCLLFEAGTVATLGESGPGAATPGGEGARLRPALGRRVPHFPRESGGAGTAGAWGSRAEGWPFE